MDHTTRMLNELLMRTGVGKQIADELEAQRVAKVAAAKKAKRAALDKLIADRPKAEAAVEATEEKQRAAQKAAEALLQEFITARERLSTVIETAQVVIEPLDRELRSLADPRIDQFRAELTELQDAAHTWYRAWPDDKGTQADRDGRRMSDNRKAIEHRIRVLIDLRDAADRLKIDPDVTDVAAEIERLRKTIPEV